MIRFRRARLNSKTLKAGALEIMRANHRTASESSSSAASRRCLDYERRLAIDGLRRRLCGSEGYKQPYSRREE